MPTEIVSFFRSVYKPLLILISIIIFFVSYNTYLIDHSLNNLKLALTQTASAQTIESTYSLQTIIDYALISELTAYKMDSGDLADLTLSRNIIARGESTMQIEDMELALKEIIERREKQRGKVLTTIDRFADAVKIVKNKLIAALITEKPEVAIQVDTSIVDQARILKKSLKLSEAIENYELFIASYPNYESIDEIRLELAYCYEQISNYKKAGGLYERITKLSGGTKEAQIALIALNKINEINFFINQKENLIARIATLKDVSELQYAYYDLGVIYNKLLDFTSAQESYKKVVELNSDTQIALKAKFNLGWTYKFRNQVEESSAVFNDILKEAPASNLAVDSKYQIADNLKLQNRYDEAISLFRQLYEEKTNEPVARNAQLRVGYTYLYDLNDPLAAKKEFDKVGIVEREKFTIDRGKEYRIKGYDYLNSANYQYASVNFKTAIGLNPKDTSAYLGLSRVYRAQGDLNGAIRIAETGCKGNTNNEYLFATLGELYTEANRNYEAIEAYKRAVEIRNNYAEALYNLGYLYHIVEQYEEAIKILEKAVLALPSYAEAYNNLGVAYWYRGRKNDAINMYKKALKLNPNYLDALYNLGLIYKSEGQYQQAKEIFLRIIKIAPSDVIAKQELEKIN